MRLAEQFASLVAFRWDCAMVDLLPSEYTPYERGMWAEAVAIRWLESCGYAVFLSVNGLGPYDLVGFKDREFTGFDVKFVKPINEAGGVGFSHHAGTKSKAQAGLAVKFVYVTPEGKCSFSKYVLNNDERLKRGLDRDCVGAGRPRKYTRDALALAPLKSLQ